MTLLVVGASGFIGTSFCKNAKGLSFSKLDSSIRINKSCNSNLSLLKKLQGKRVVLHLAGLAHCSYSNLDLKDVNYLGVLELATAAARCGVKRFIYLSSLNVHGLQSAGRFKVSDRVDPQELSAIYKQKAEVGLRKISEEMGMEVVIIRPPLVYGANAPGNFGKFSDLVKKNLPLPLGAINNKRSLVGIDNLVDLITTCIDHPKAANQTFLVSDNHDVSTSELLRSMIIAVGKKPRLIPVPVSVLRFFAGFLGKSSVIDRMSSSLQVDISHTKDTLGWQPPVSFEEGICRCFK